AGTYVFEYTPWIDWGMLGIEHTYTIAQSMTKSGVVHVGTHPDVDLRDYVWGEKVAVLVCDPNSAGVYDTVYVDLDDDYDFRNEKPLTRADMSDPNTYNNMICYRDFDGDGIADLSGGALYFIADGVNVLPGSDYLYGAEPGGFLCPGNGDLVAFTGGSFGYDYSHGTQCASAIAGQGIINAKVPTFVEGSVGGAVLGVAPKAKLVDVSDIYWNFDSSLIDAYLFVAVGYDGVNQANLDVATGELAADTDPIQVVSNSYGYSDMDNDGWDYLSQVVAVLMNFWAPYQQYTFSTGNGGPGFGTAAPPSPVTAVLVGASTEFSATGWDSITSTAQINVNDVIPFSNRGPGANGHTGVNVVASGAYAPGDEALNYYGMAMWGRPDGTLCWDSWGGTSRSSPVAAGVLALIYDAWFQTTDQWPEGAAAKVVLQSTATDLKYDVLSQGSGSVNGGAAVDVASRQSGLIAVVPEADKGTTEWQPGDYHGVDYPAFAHVIEPGATDTTEVRVADFSSPMQPTLARDVELKLIKQDEFDFTVTPQMVDSEYDYGVANRDNFYKAFQYMIPITAVPGMDDSWYNLDVPPDTELMVVRALFPFDELDTDGNYIQDNRFYLMVYNWTDVNGNGIVWDDKDGNGVVNIINRPEVIFDYDLIDGGMELNWDDPRNELDRYEYARFGYHRPTSNRLEMWVSDPLGRMQDGLFIGLRHLPPDRYSGATHLKFRVEYYSKQDCPWLELSSRGDTMSTGAVIVPPATDLLATAAPSADMKPGIYEAAIEIVRLPTGAEPFETAPDQIAPDLWDNPVIVPVVMTVVQPMPTAGGDWQFGGEETYSDAYNAGRLYNNGCVRGQFDWSWRTESGDWRFFFQDLPEDAITTEGRSYLIVQDQWDGPAPYNDIDTIVLGPNEYDWSDPAYTLVFDMPEYFGPYTLDEIARSPIALFGDATWMFNTSSGANEDWVGAPLYDSGLHAILQHHVLADGDNFDIVFTKTLGLMDINPPSLEVETCTAAGELGEVTISSNIGFDELMVEAYGLGYVQKFEDLEIPFDGVQGSWDATLTVEHAGAMVFVIDS
ncbi:MAG: S8 family serine peptidase, partial [Planctomycetes bacterium]|nr:S8 family serine peptidase [Planctomycetota bacterium]